MAGIYRIPQITMDNPALFQANADFTGQKKRKDMSQELFSNSATTDKLAAKSMDWGNVAQAGVAIADAGIQKSGIGDQSFGDVSMEGFNLKGTGIGLKVGLNPALMAATGGLSAPVGAVLGLGADALMYKKRLDRFHQQVNRYNMKTDLNLDYQAKKQNDYTGLMRKGGQALAPINVEGNEIGLIKKGKRFVPVFRTNEKAPSHEEGGVDLKVPSGTQVFNRQLLEDVEEAISKGRTDIIEQHLIPARDHILIAAKKMGNEYADGAPSDAKLAQENPENRKGGKVLTRRGSSNKNSMVQIINPERNEDFKLRLPSVRMEKGGEAGNDPKPKKPAYSWNSNSASQPETPSYTTSQDAIKNAKGKVLKKDELQSSPSYGYDIEVPYVKPRAVIPQLNPRPQNGRPDYTPSEMADWNTKQDRLKTLQTVGDYASWLAGPEGAAAWHAGKAGSKVNQGDYEGAVGELGSFATGLALSEVPGLDKVIKEGGALLKESAGSTTYANIIDNTIKGGIPLRDYGKKQIGPEDDLFKKLTAPYIETLDRDIHDIRFDYHNNNKVLTLREQSLLKEKGFGDPNNYKGDSEGLLLMLGQEARKTRNVGKEPIDLKSNKPIIETSSKYVNETNLYDNTIIENNNIIIDKTNPIPRKSTPILMRSRNTREADKWISDWFKNPSTKTRYETIVGSDKGYNQILKNNDRHIIQSSLSNKQVNAGGAGIPGRAEIARNMPVSYGVHEAVHKAHLANGESIASKFEAKANYLTDGTANIEEGFSEIYPEIMRMRFQEGWKPGEIISENQLAKGLEKMGDGYNLKGNVIDMKKLLKAVNTLPALLPAAALMNDGLQIPSHRKGGKIIMYRKGYSSKHIPSHAEGGEVEGNDPDPKKKATKPAPPTYSWGSVSPLVKSAPKINPMYSTRAADASPKEKYFDNPEPEGLKPTDSTTDWAYSLKGMGDNYFTRDIIRKKILERAQSANTEGVETDEKTKRAYDVGLNKFLQDDSVDNFFESSPYIPNASTAEFLPTYRTKQEYQGNKDSKFVSDFISGNSEQQNVDSLINRVMNLKEPIKFSSKTVSPSLSLLNMDMNKSGGKDINLGNSTTGLAWDEEKKLPYISHFDVYDFKPSQYAEMHSNTKDPSLTYKRASVMQQYGKPFNMYNRLYFDPKTKQPIVVPSNRKGGMVGDPKRDESFFMEGMVQKQQYEKEQALRDEMNQRATIFRYQNRPKLNIAEDPAVPLSESAKLFNQKPTEQFVIKSGLGSARYLDDMIAEQNKPKGNIATWGRPKEPVISIDRKKDRSHLFPEIDLSDPNTATTSNEKASKRGFRISKINLPEGKEYSTRVSKAYDQASLYNLGLAAVNLAQPKFDLPAFQTPSLARMRANTKPLEQAKIEVVAAGNQQIEKLKASGMDSANLAAAAGQVNANVQQTLNKIGMAEEEQMTQIQNANVGISNQEEQMRTDISNKWTVANTDLQAQQTQAKATATGNALNEAVKDQVMGAAYDDKYDALKKQQQIDMTGLNLNRLESSYENKIKQIDDKYGALIDNALTGHISDDDKDFLAILGNSANFAELESDTKYKALSEEEKQLAKKNKAKEFYRNAYSTVLREKANAEKNAILNMFQSATDQLYNSLTDTNE